MRFRERFQLLAGMALLMWAIELADALIFSHELDQFGIRPRSLRGLFGILFAPFLHGDFKHLALNTPPLLILGGIAALAAGARFVNVTVAVVFAGGLGVWLVAGTNTVHIGASGLIFGYFGYLLLRGWFERRPMSLLAATAVVLLYGGMAWGLLPGQKGVSWVGHVFGFLAGGLAAALDAARRLRARSP